MARLKQMLKKEGIKDITAEVCPHHLILTSDDIKRDDPDFKMNPPLRTKEDVEALKKGLKEGVLEVISTDHAPHSAEEKSKDFTKAPFGIVGLETAASLTYSELVLGGYLTPMQMAEKMSYNPAKVIGIDKGDISVGKIADLVIFDPDKEYEVTEKEFAGKSKNSPFIGWTLTGKVCATVMGGKITYELREKEEAKGIKKVIQNIVDKFSKS